MVGVGAAYGTAKAGVGVASIGVNRPELIMKSVIPVIMAGMVGIYGLIIAVFLATTSALSCSLRVLWSARCPVALSHHFLSFLGSPLSFIIDGYLNRFACSRRSDSRYFANPFGLIAYLAPGPLFLAVAFSESCNIYWCCVRARVVVDDSGSG